MKKVKIVFILILVSSLNIQAQDYQPVRSGRIAFFKNVYGGINCIRIDSAKYDSDSVFYPFSNIQQLGMDCYTPYGPSWLGFQIITKSDGLIIFLNRDLDSVKIRKNSLLNESWTAYESRDSLKVIATLVEHDTISIFGQIDSAKTITFQVYDKNMIPINDKLNTMSIIISKNYGLVKTLNFSLFPDLKPDYFYQYQFQEYYLAGLSNPKLGIQNISWYDVHDFLVGDEIHVSYVSSLWWVPETILADSIKTIFKYLVRTDCIDSIVYSIERIQSQKHIAGINVSFKYLHDTIKTIIKPNPIFEKLPGEVIISDNQISSYSMNFDTFLSKTEPSDYTTFHHNIDSCWSNCCADGCFPVNTYIKGLGGPYYECSNFDSGGGLENRLVYFKKGNVSWGTPFVITSVEDKRIQDDFEIYPNPAKDFIVITVQNPEFPILLELSDIEGRVVFALELNSGSSTVNIENLSPGIYIYRFSKSREIIKTRKLIIE